MESIFKKYPVPAATADEHLTNEEKKKKAREHWRKLRDHIHDMNKKVNFLVTTLDEANEAK